MNKKRAKHKKSHLKAGGFIKNLDGRRMRRFAPRTARKLFNSSLSLTAYPSYQVPFRERRVPFLLVKFHYIIAEKEMFCNENHFI